MKKILIALIALVSFTVSANAAEITNKCPKWEHGNVVYYNGKQQNTPGTSPSAFCWDIVQVQGDGYYNGNWYKKENLSSSSTLLAKWFATEAEYVYSTSGSILNGKQYTFFLRYIPVSQATYMSDIDVYDYIKVYDGATLKSTTLIQ